MSTQLAMPTGYDMCTMSWAAERIGVSRRTVGRLVADGTLASVRPRAGSRESSRNWNMLWTSQVQEYAAAYKLTKGRADG